MNGKPVTDHVIVVGAGAGGLAAAIDLASHGARVTVVEGHDRAGGKIHQTDLAASAAGSHARPIDSGPTVFTMRPVFDELFAAAGASLDAELTLSPLAILARHAWPCGGVLDLHADIDRSAEAIAEFAGREDAAGYRRLARDSAAVFDMLHAPFIRHQRPGQLDVVARIGLTKMPQFVARINATASLWRNLGQYFRDPRLRQLFARYATYVGSSPFATPSTIKLIAHVEQSGVWSVAGGMQAVAEAMERVARRQGTVFRFGSPVTGITVAGGRAAGVTLANGERIKTDAVIFNGDIAALGAGLLGEQGRRAGRAFPPPRRSLSAVTLKLLARTSGTPLAFHTVAFTGDYKAEFKAVFDERRIPDEPTVYVCAPDRDGSGQSVPAGEVERVFCLINAPASGGEADWGAEARARARARIGDTLTRCGIAIAPAGEEVLTTPEEFGARFPASHGALYGQHCHGMTGTLDRAGARTAIDGLYLAGGSVHPGPGVPMAVLSGRLAGAQYRHDRAPAPKPSRAL